MMEAVISLKIPQNWMSEIPEKHPVTIKVIERVPFSEKGVKDLVEIAGPHDIMEEVLRDIKKNPLVSKIDTTMTDKGKIIGAIKRDHDNDDTLKAHVLLENMVSKASGSLAMLKAASIFGT